MRLAARETGTTFIMSAAPSSTGQREVIAAHCRERDVKCPACRYSLRGCQSDRCPECGCELALAVVPRRPLASAWWSAAVYGTVVSAIVSTFILAAMLPKVVDVLETPHLFQWVRAGVESRTRLPNWFTLIAIVIINAMVGLCLAWLLNSRTAFHRRPAMQRALIALGCWLSPLLVLGMIRIMTLLL
jgi:hypothetical protein